MRCERGDPRMMAAVQKGAHAHTRTRGRGPDSLPNTGLAGHAWGRGVLVVVGLAWRALQVTARLGLALFRIRPCRAFHTFPAAAGLGCLSGVTRQRVRHVAGKRELPIARGVVPFSPAAANHVPASIGPVVGLPGAPVQKPASRPWWWWCVCVCRGGGKAAIGLRCERVHRVSCRTLLH